MSILTTFIILSIINVIFSTIRSITTIKSGKIVASLVSGGYFAFYNIMLLYTVADFSMTQKCVITFVCNVIGVFLVKLVEQKMRKDKVWKIEFSVPAAKENRSQIDLLLTQKEVSHRSFASEKYVIFECFCDSQEKSSIVKNIIELNDCKYFASETKIL